MNWHVASVAVPHVVRLPLKRRRRNCQSLSNPEAVVAAALVAVPPDVLNPSLGLDGVVAVDGWFPRCETRVLRGGSIVAFRRERRGSKILSRSVRKNNLHGPLAVVVLPWDVALCVDGVKQESRLEVIVERAALRIEPWENNLVVD